MNAAAESLILAERTVRRFFRVPAAVVVGVVFPVTLFLIMLASFGRLFDASTPGGYVMRLAPLIMLSATNSGAGISAIAFHREIHTMFGRFRAMPIRASSVLAGWVAGDVVRVMLNCAAITVVAICAGFRFRQGFLPLLAFFAVVAAFGIAVTWLAVLVGMTAPSEESAQSTIGPPTTLLFFLSSGFVPAAAFPGALQPFVRANPMSCTVNAMMGLSGGGPIAVPVFQTLAWCAAIGAVCAAMAIRRYRSLARRS
jgi:ABC-2 type transport system permease protein